MVEVDFGRHVLRDAFGDLLPAVELVDVDLSSVLRVLRLHEEKRQVSKSPTIKMEYFTRILAFLLDVGGTASSSALKPPWPACSLVSAATTSFTEGQSSRMTYPRPLILGSLIEEGQSPACCRHQAQKASDHRTPAARAAATARESCRLINRALRTAQWCGTATARGLPRQ